MKVLVIDRPFPSLHAQWRIEEVKSFITKYGADFLSIGSDESHFGSMSDYYGINDYNILIFNSRFNNDNKFNKKINGIKFNGKFQGDFVVTKDTTFDLSSYDVIYHIFYSRWMVFNQLYPGKIPDHKQFVHLYPGGRVKNWSNIGISKNVNIITTQKYITEYVIQQGYTSYTEIIGASFLQKGHQSIPRELNNGRMNICYSSFGKPEIKGGDTYIQAAELYKKLYPKDNINFISVGVCNTNRYITKHNFLPMETLKKVYDSVDVYVSPERGSVSNGWPLGIEAGLRGSVLITTDPFNSADNHPFGKDVLIIKRDDPKGIVDHIKRLYDDRELLNSISRKIQAGLTEFYSFENQQQKIFDFIESKVM